MHRIEQLRPGRRLSIVMGERLGAVAGGVRAHLANLGVQLARFVEILGDTSAQFTQQCGVVAAAGIAKVTGATVKGVSARRIRGDAVSIFVGTARGHACGGLPCGTIPLAVGEGRAPGNHRGDIEGLLRSIGRRRRKTRFAAAHQADGHANTPERSLQRSSQTTRHFRLSSRGGLSARLPGFEPAISHHPQRRLQQLRKNRQLERAPNHDDGQRLLRLCTNAVGQRCRK